MLIQVNGHRRALPRPEVRALLELADRHAGVDVAHCCPGAERGVVVLRNLSGAAVYERPAVADGGAVLLAAEPE